MQKEDYVVFLDLLSCLLQVVAKPVPTFSMVLLLKFSFLYNFTLINPLFRFIEFDGGVLINESTERNGKWNGLVGCRGSSVGREWDWTEIFT